MAKTLIGVTRGCFFKERRDRGAKRVETIALAKVLAKQTLQILNVLWSFAGAFCKYAGNDQPTDGQTDRPTVSDGCSASTWPSPDSLLFAPKKDSAFLEC